MSFLRIGKGSGDPSPARYAAILAVPYFLIAWLYVLLTSGLAGSLAVDTAQLALIEKLKGTAFIFLSALFIYFVSRVLFARILAQKREIDTKTAALLQSENRAVAGVFASSIAHDMNNIMMGLYNDVAEYATLPGLPEEEKERASRLRFAAGEMIALASHLSRSGREDGGAPGTPLRVSLAPLVEETVAFARHHRRIRHCNLEVSITAGGTIEGVPVILRQILLNLLLNAADATDGEGRLRVCCEEGEGTAVLEVHDDGPGVAVEQRGTIFEAFHTTRESGSGLGLHSVRAGVEVHGGRVEVTESPLGGALFRITLPLVEE